jgi:DNA-binding transcriptional regulator YhcF (GntR family)
METYETYDRLAAEGYLYSKRRAGLFVSESLPEDFLLAQREPSARQAYSSRLETF